MFEIHRKHSVTPFLAGRTRFSWFQKSIKPSLDDSRIRWMKSKKIPKADRNSIIRNLKKEETESENFMKLSHLTQLSIREYFIGFYRRKIFKTQNKQQKHRWLPETVWNTALKLRIQVVHYQQHCDCEIRSVIETVARRLTL